MSVIDSQQAVRDAQLDLFRVTAKKENIEQELQQFTAPPDQELAQAIQDYEDLITIVREEMGVDNNYPLETITQDFYQTKGMYDTLAQLIKEAEQRKEEITDELRGREEAASILLSLEIAYRKHFEEMLSRVVSDAVHSVFPGEDNEIKVRTKTVGDVSGMEVVALHDGIETHIFDTKGGSFAQVVAFTLRVIMTALSPNLRNILILDEPFGMVSAEYRRGLADLIHTLAEQLDMQFIIVTHEAELLDAADTAYEIDKHGNHAILMRVKHQDEEAHE